MTTELTLTNHRFLILLDQDYEDLEYWYPKLRLLEAGTRVVTAGPRDGQKLRGKHGYPAVCDAMIHEMESADFEGLIVQASALPGLSNAMATGRVALCSLALFPFTRRAAACDFVAAGNSLTDTQKRFSDTATIVGVDNLFAGIDHSLWVYRAGGAQVTLTCGGHPHLRTQTPSEGVQPDAVRFPAPSRPFPRFREGSKCRRHNAVALPGSQLTRKALSVDWYNNAMIYQQQLVRRLAAVVAFSSLAISAAADSPGDNSAKKPDSPAAAEPKYPAWVEWTASPTTAN